MIMKLCNDSYSSKRTCRHVPVHLTGVVASLLTSAAILFLIMQSYALEIKDHGFRQTANCVAVVAVAIGGCQCIWQLMIFEEWLVAVI